MLAPGLPGLADGATHLFPEEPITMSENTPQDSAQSTPSPFETFATSGSDFVVESFASFNEPIIDLGSLPVTVGEPDGAVPVAVEAETVEPVGVESEALEAEIVESAVVEPVGVEPEEVEAEVVETAAVEPVCAESEEVAAEVVESTAVEPVCVESEELEAVVVEETTDSIDVLPESDEVAVDEFLSVSTTAPVDTAANTEVEVVAEEVDLAAEDVAEDVAVIASDEQSVAVSVVESMPVAETGQAESIESAIARFSTTAQDTKVEPESVPAAPETTIPEPPVAEKPSHTVRIKITPEGPKKADAPVPQPQAETPAPVSASLPASVPASANDAVEVSSDDAEGGPLFRDLPLSDAVQQAVEETGYTQPTDIQAQIIPHVLEGRDVLAQSQTGTGKTAAFALPVLSRIDVNRRKPQVLVLAPTRELAMQVTNSFGTYGRFIPNFSALAIYGGQSYDTQLRQLRRGVQVVVGTPGRVIDHIKRGTLDLSELECLVLDEADEMLNMGFLDDVQFVLEQTPDERQVALFSATLPTPIRNIAKRYLNDPVRISIKQKTMTGENIRQRAVFVSPRDKVDALTRFVEAEKTDGVIVFTKTREATVTVAEQLCREGLKAVALNGDMPQNVRERTIGQLKSGKLDILVATDVAARGLDVSRVSHVFNYDMPHDSESYVHRIGRTGRAGRNGDAIIFLTKGQRGRLRTIERVTKQRIEIVDPPTADEINAFRIERFKQKITDVISQEDLSMFQTMVTEYAEASSQPMEKVAAALAVIGQQGRSFLMTDRPRRNKFDRDERSDSRDGRGGRDRFEQRRDNSGARPDRRRNGPPESGMDRYRIEVGRDDGVMPSNIVGAVANEGGIDGDYIGPIRIHDAFSTIDLPEGMPREVFQTLQQTVVAGKELRLRRASEEDSQGGGGSRPGGHGGPRRGRPGPPRKKFDGGRKFGGGGGARSHQGRKPRKRNDRG